jgi:SAM-dependent methyltransferase
MKIERSYDNDTVARLYLESLGLNHYRTEHHFWEVFQRTHGPAARREYQALLSSRRDPFDRSAYEKVHGDIGLSLDLSSYLYEQQLSWIAWLRPNVISARRILDLGCGNGLVTCFVAWQLPASSVVGVDRCRNALRVGAALAKRLRLKNVSFVCSDFVADGLPGPRKSYDLVTSKAVFSSLLTGARSDWQMSERVGLASAGPSAQVLSAIYSWLNHGGRLLSAERLPTGGADLWPRLLVEVGFSITSVKFVRLRKFKLGGGRSLFGYWDAAIRSTS